MTDRELLELAAKAIGKRVRIYDGMIVEPGTDCVCVDEAGIKWNPLTDDGDALRLAVKLNIHITSSATDAWATTPTVTAIEPMGGNPYAATRRAIVRAAAEIGRGM